MLPSLHDLEHMVSEIQNQDLVHALRHDARTSMVAVLLLSFRRMVERYIPIAFVALHDGSCLWRNADGCEQGDEFYKKQMIYGCV